MALEFDVRPSDAALVDCVWRGRSTGVGTFNSVASSHWHLVVSEIGGQVEVSVHGPESRPVATSLPPEGSWVGIRFRLGVMLQDLPIPNLVDGGIVLPEREPSIVLVEGRHLGASDVRQRRGPGRAAGARGPDRPGAPGR